jgi:hypothetical protein
MPSELESWARAERQFLRDELNWLNAGSKVASPSGEDITATKIAELEARLEHVGQVLKTIPTPRSAERGVRD